MPAPGGPSPYTLQTQTNLDQDEAKDSGLGLEWVYLNADVGGSYLGLQTIHSDDLAVTDTSSVGAMIGVGAGVRLLALTLGGRVRNHLHSAFDLWQFNAELGLHVRVGRLDPYFGLRGGYVTTASLSQTVATVGNDRPTADVSVRGGNVGLMLGLDYYFSHLLSVGAEASGDVLFLTRPKADLPPGVASLPQAERDRLANDPLFRASGGGVGLGAALSAHVGLHF